MSDERAKQDQRIAEQLLARAILDHWSLVELSRIGDDEISLRIRRSDAKWQQMIQES